MLAWVVWDINASTEGDELQSTYGQLSSNFLILLSLVFVTGLAVADWAVGKMIDTVWAEGDPLLKKTGVGAQSQE